MKKMSRGQRIWKMLTGRKYRQIVVGVGMFSVILICAIFAPLIAHQDPSFYDVPNRMLPPSSAHLFGTDVFGRDVFARTIYGARTSLAISVSVTVLCGVVGIFLGLIAGYFRRLEAVIMRVMDALMAFPNILLALIIVAALGAGAINVIIALALASIPSVTRMVRGIVLTVKEQDHVAAAKASGAKTGRILFFHIFLLCISPITVILTLILATTTLAEASLTFLGVGLPPELPSWGNIISDGRTYISTAWWLTVIPGFAILWTVISVNVLGDGVRDMLDPRLRNL
ncbi:MAG: ABC transporter permease [Clostridiales Family XIII bacterium]|jgi:ABC-type dipeptide/oligopeptide/nickel transport system permease subunit|nr:ABC transporter permease [Clostridiales Family XIII bacterium]